MLLERFEIVCETVTLNLQFGLAILGENPGDYNMNERLI